MNGQMMGGMMGPQDGMPGAAGMGMQNTPPPGDIFSRLFGRGPQNLSLMSQQPGGMSPQLGPAGPQMGPGMAPSIGSAAMPGAAPPMAMPSMGGMPPPPAGMPMGGGNGGPLPSRQFSPGAPLPMQWQPQISPSQGGGLDMIMKALMGG